MSGAIQEWRRKKPIRQCTRSQNCVKGSSCPSPISQRNTFPRCADRSTTRSRSRFYETISPIQDRSADLASSICAPTTPEKHVWENTLRRERESNMPASKSAQEQRAVPEKKGREPS